MIASPLRRLMSLLFAILMPAVAMSQEPIVGFIQPAANASFTSPNITVEWKACSVRTSISSGVTRVNAQGYSHTVTTASLNDCSATGQTRSRNKYTAAVVLQAGSNLIDIEACDANGCSGSLTRTVYYTPPHGLVITPDNAWTSVVRGSSGSYNFSVQNTGASSETVSLVVSCSSGVSCSGTETIAVPAFTTVSKTAYFTGAIEGTATLNVTGTVQENTSIVDAGAIQISITPKPVAYVVLSNVGPGIIGTGQTTTFWAQTYASDWEELTGRSVSWSGSGVSMSPSSGSSKAITTVTGQSAGTATVTASSEGINGSANVSVVNPTYTVAVSSNRPSSITLASGATNTATTVYTVTNTSTYTNPSPIFTMSASPTGVIGTCSVSPSSAAIAPGNATTVSVSCPIGATTTTSYPTVTFTAATSSPASFSQSHVTTYTVSPNFAFSIALLTSNPRTEAQLTSSDSAVFRISNNSINTGGPSLVTFSASCGGVVSCSAPASVYVTQGSYSDVTLPYSVSLTGQNGTAALSGSHSSGASTGTSTLTVNTTPYYNVVVTASNVPLDSGALSGSITYTVTNNSANTMASGATRTLNLGRSCDAPLLAGCSGATTIALADRSSGTVTTTFNVTATGTSANAQLTASSSSPSFSHTASPVVSIAPYRKVTVTSNAPTLNLAARTRSSFSRYYIANDSRNTGATSYNFLLTAGCTGMASGCSIPNPTVVTVYQNDAATFDVPYNVSITGTSGSTTLTASHANFTASTATQNLTITPYYSTVVTPAASGPPLPKKSLNGSTTFTVKSLSENAPPTAFSLTRSCGLAAVTCNTPNPASVTLSYNETSLPITISYGIGNQYHSGSVSLAAAAPTGSVVGNGTHLFSVTPWYAVLVTPVTATQSVAAGATGSHSVQLQNVSWNSAQSLKVSVQATGCINGILGACSVSGAPITVSQGSSGSVPFSYAGHAAGSEVIALTAQSADVPMDSVVGGTLTVTVTNSAVLTTIARGLNPSTVIERGECLTIAAGGGAAYECGDLRAVHQLPSTRTMSQSRTPTLIYNSRHATGTSLIAANVIYTGTTTPETIIASVSIDGIAQPEKVFRWAPSCASTSCRLVYPTSTLLPGLHVYTISTRAVAGGVTLAPSNTVTDTLIAVNRASSPFGAGWWLEGLERLHFISAQRTLWVGGDGSARLYSEVGSGVFVAPGFDRADTLLKVGVDKWRRPLGNGAYVQFDGQGRHELTRNAVAWVTSFSYLDGGADSPLQSITLPVRIGTSARSYQFAYANTTSGGKILTTVTAPPLATQARIVTTKRLTSETSIDSLIDPDGVATGFAYQDARLTARRSRGTDLSTYGYDAAGALERATVHMVRTDTGSSKNLTQWFRAAETRSASIASDTLRPLSKVYTRLDGPRTARPDTTVFFVNRWGMVDLVVDTAGHQTRARREDLRFPSLVTRTIAANSFEQRAHYNFRGLPDSIVQVNPLSTASFNAVTKYSWHPVWDHQVSTVAPTGEVELVGYFTDTIPLIEWSQVGTSTSRRTYFTYDRGMIASVRPPGNSASQTQRYEYDTFGNLQRSISPTDHVSLFYNDSVGRVYASITPVSAADVSNSAVQANGLYTYLGYDVLDRPTSHRTVGKQFSGAGYDTLVVTTEYDEVANRKVVSRRAAPDINGLGTLRDSTWLDAAGRVIVVSSAGAPGVKERTIYDPTGAVDTLVTRRGDRITLKYNALNQLKERAVPAVFYQRQPRGVATFSQATFDPLTPYYPLYPLSDSASLADTVIAGYTEQYFYGVTGAVEKAVNRDAIVQRQYHPSGLLKTDSLWVRAYSGASGHWYGLTFGYDSSGRRTTLGHPAGLGHTANTVTSYQYDPGTGALSNVSDGLTSFGLSYTDAGQLSVVAMPGGIERRMGYDQAGRLTGDTIRLTPSSWRRRTRLKYDGRGKVDSAFNTAGLRDTLIAKYDGLGHMRSSDYSAWQVNRSGVYETFTVDALGNPYTGQTAQPQPGLIGSGQDVVPTQWQYAQSGTGRLTRQIRGTNNDFEFDAGGNVVFESATAAMTTERAQYYDAMNRLRAVDKRIGQPNKSVQEWRVNVFEEYRYDPLGRRVLVRSRHRCDQVTGETADRVALRVECQSSLIRRTVWDGSEELYEIQMPGEAGADTLVLENDVGSVTPVSSDAGIDRYPLYGRVGYLHGPGVDEPLAVTRLGYRELQPSGVVTFPAFALVPHWNSRGKPDDGSQYGSGGFCSGSGCITKFTFPGSYSPYMQAYIRQLSWQGTILDDKRDMSGSLYRRNRYLDAAAGRFTQEDPIGLAGGMNLYGFAAGDPITYSDPFGLCPPIESCLRALGDVGVGMTPGVSTVADAATMLTGRNLVTGEREGWSGRFVAAIGLFTPASGGEIRGATEVTKNWILPRVDEVLESLKAMGAKVRNHSTKNGQGAAIDFGDGTVLDIRVETHPLTPGGQPKYHGNVEKFENGKRKNKHVDP